MDQERSQDAMQTDLLAAIVRSSDDAIISLDPDGIILTWNRAAERTFGFSEAEVVGQSIAVLVSPDLREDQLRILSRVRNGEHLDHYETVRVAKSGRRLDISLTVSPLRDVTGKIVGIAKVARDISTQKHSEEALLRRLEFERFLFDLSKTFIGLPEEAVDVNMERGLARVGAFLGMDRVTLLELSPDRLRMNVVYSWKASGVQAAGSEISAGAQPWWLRQVLRGEASLASEIDDLPPEATAERAYLRERGVASAASVPLKVGGTIAGAISFITAHRRVTWTEELVAELRVIGDILWNALKRRQSMQALQSVLETATQGIASVDPEGTVVTANRALELMFGWSAGTLVGQPIEVLMPSALRRGHQQHRLRYFAAPHPRLMGGGLHLVGERRDGSTFPIEVSLNHVVAPGGARAFAFVTDITERQQRTAQLEHRTAQLSRLASDLTLAEHHAREQLAKALHDGLQQLLVSALLSLDRRMTLDQQQRGGFDELLLQVKQHLEEAMGAARSLSFELFPPVLHSSGLPAALRWLADHTRNKYGLEVIVRADPAANSERKDVRTLLFESVRELLLNVVKHAHVDRVTVDLVLDRDDRLCIMVEDRGVGFEPATLPEREKTGHAGWGLFSIRERLSLLGGRLEIESTPGDGTRFTVIAPRVGTENVVTSGEVPGDFATSAALGAVLERLPARPLRILIADDHVAVRNVYRELLEQRSELHVVGDAFNGLEAIAQAHVLYPDVILMDVSMPEMDGVESTRRIRAELPSIRILGLSMQPRTDVPHAIESAGAIGFFNKATDTQRLLDHLIVMHRTLSSAP